jgi:hypothetical protein
MFDIQIKIHGKHISFFSLKCQIDIEMGTVICFYNGYKASYQDFFVNLRNTKNAFDVLYVIVLLSEKL